jgi:hypothetical protein
VARYPGPACPLRLAWQTEVLVPDDIDPSVAEALILRALGADQPLDASLEAKVEVQTVLLGVLAADLELDDAGLHLFVGQARELADGWLAERG